MSETASSVLAVVDDLFFGVKISDAAKRTGLRVLFVKTTEAALNRLAESPALVVIDLNCASVDPVALVSQMKAGEFRGIPVIGYVSHVQTELRQRAEQAGFDAVFARSVFSTSMQELFRRHATPSD